jgi:hypothetical protein
MSTERKSVLIGHGVLLPAAVCRSVVESLRAHAWWQRSEIGEGDERAVDLTSCRSLWCSLSGPHRRIVLKRLAGVARAVSPGGVTPRCEEPVVLRYTPGGFFKRHRDVYTRPENAAGRNMSVVAFLTGHGEPGGYQGGELRFYLREAGGGQTCVRVPGRVGQFVVFAAEVEHEVLPVLAGERLTLVSWLY